MNTIEPVLYEHNMTLIIVGLILGVVLILVAIIWGMVADTFLAFFVPAILAAVVLVPSLTYLYVDGKIKNVSTYNNIATHYDVVLPSLNSDSRTDSGVRFVLEKDVKQFISLDVLDEKTQEVYEDARIVWDGKEISLLVKAEGSEEYVPLRK